MTNTVCILAAGRGTRMVPLSASVNKALLPVREKAAISWIMDSFRTRLGVNTHFVVALGSGAEDIRDYLALAYSDLRVTFVNVEPFEGPGSGPGASALSCEPYLRTPFYLCCCDTLWTEEWREDRAGQNWLGVATVTEGFEHYCNVKIQAGRVLAIRDKVKTTGPDFRAFTGLAHIQDYDLFFSGLRSGQAIQQEIQLSSGFANLLDQSHVEAVEMRSWIDIGTHEKYLRALASLDQGNFRKHGELFYRVEGAVVKFFADPEIVRNRVLRAALMPDVFPKILGHRDRFFSYQYWNGETLYESDSREQFPKLLDWLDRNFWKIKSDPTGGSFYQEKACARIAQFESARGPGTKDLFVNGMELPRIETLLAKVDWTQLETWVPSFIHGDLQFDNILFDKNSGEFILIDWRQDFHGRLDCGDLYYDLAKLYLGLQYDLSAIKFGDFHVAIGERDIQVRLRPIQSKKENLAVLADFISQKNLDLQRVQLIASLALVSMAGLHEAPLADAFYHLGRLHLAHGWP